MASFSSSSLFFPAPFISHNHHGFFFSPPSGIRRLSLCKLESFSRSIGCSREVSNIPTNGVVKWNSVSIKAEGLQQTEPMVPPYNVLITGSTKGVTVFISSFSLSFISHCVIFWFPFESIHFLLVSRCILLEFIAYGIWCPFFKKELRYCGRLTVFLLFDEKFGGGVCICMLNFCRNWFWETSWLYFVEKWKICV